MNVFEEVLVKCTHVCLHSDCKWIPKLDLRERPLVITIVYTTCFFIPPQEGCGPYAAGGQSSQYKMMQKSDK